MPVPFTGIRMVKPVIIGWFCYLALQEFMSAFSLFASLPNLITLGRLVAVPVIITLIVLPNWSAAFALFLVAGVSDAVDGYLAKRYNLQTELGAYLDPIADKALLISIYIALAISGVIPAFIAILVVSRDVMIVGAIIVAWVMEKPMKIRPLFISKANTTVQIAFATAVLAAMAFSLDMGLWFNPALVVVAVLTLASGAVYFYQWLLHMDI